LRCAALMRALDPSRGQRSAVTVCLLTLLGVRDPPPHLCGRSRAVPRFAIRIHKCVALPRLVARR
jgi:hypothetical protein